VWMCINKEQEDESTYPMIRSFPYSLGQNWLMLSITLGSRDTRNDMHHRHDQHENNNSQFRILHPTLMNVYPYENATRRAI
jgi:hypothetical protein